MSAEEADKTTTTDASAGDEEEEWLYGDESESKDEDEEAKLNAAVSAPADASTEDAAVAAHATGNGVASEAAGEAAGEDVDTDSDSDDDDDDVRVTIGDIKTGAPQYTPYGAPPVNLNIKTTGSRPYGQDYFNYGFNEDTWKAYCEKQKRLRMGLEVSTVGSVTSKITVQQGRTGNEKDMSSLPVHTSKPDFTSPVTLYKLQSAVSQVTRKTSGTIDVIGGGTATISRVEGRRRHNLDGNNIQVISEHSTSEAEPAPAKMPAFFPPGPLPPNIPPPPFLPPPPNVSNAPPLIPPPRLPITVPPPGFPPPPSGPPPAIIPTMDSDEERYRYREYQERGYGERHRDRTSREKEERHRERRHREKEEGRHKSSRSSSSRRRHDSEEGDSHRRHKHKKSKRSKEGKEASEEISADQGNQEAME
eukprot:superscaffoldBa00002635_g14865